MKPTLMVKLYGKVLLGMIKKDLPNKKTQKLIKKEYLETFIRAKDIGQNNNLLSSYMLGCFFIAMNRKDGLDVETNYQILKKGMENSKLLKMFLGDSKSYFSEKKMAFRRKWSSETKKKKYPNDWVVEVKEKTDDYQFGFDYLECGVCKLFKDEGVFEWAKYLCKLDFMLVELIGIKLNRTTTLAEGGDKCDFRFVKKED